MPQQKQKYIVWSYDTDDPQVFADVITATSEDRAIRRVERMRPCAIIDSLVPAMLLADYIDKLQKFAGKVA